MDKYLYYLCFQFHQTLKILRIIIIFSGNNVIIIKLYTELANTFRCCQKKPWVYHGNRCNPHKIIFTSIVI